MSFLKHFVVLSIIGVLLSASNSLAGGSGGTKSGSTLKVVNESSHTVFFTDNPTSSAIQKAFTDGSISEFTAAGGKILNAGSSASFSVGAGTVSIAADAVNSAGNGLLGYITENVTVGSKATVTVYIKTSTATAGIVFSSTK
jgi:hypothetical protein